MVFTPHSVFVSGDLVPIAGRRHREEVVERLENALEAVNLNFSEKIEMPLKICVGNEWRGVARSLSAAFEIDFFLRYQMFPLKIAAGIGVGEISGSYLEGVAMLGGSAVMRARQGIERARRHRGGVFLASGLPALDTGANTISLLLQTIFETWTEKQLEAYLAYRENGTEALAANKVGITQSALHQRLAAAKAKTYELASEQLLWFVDHFPVNQEEGSAVATEM